MVRFMSEFFSSFVMFFRPSSNVSFDEALLERAKSTPSGVVEVYDRYADRIFGYFLRRCGHRETAEDLTSKLFLQFLKALPTLEWRGLPLEAWLFRSASNALVDYWRAQGIRFQTSLDEENEEGEPKENPASPLPAPDEVAHVTLASEQVRDLMKQLSPRDQEVLDLRFFAELEPMEMAKILNTSANHASVLVYRALGRLRLLSLKLL